MMTENERRASPKNRWTRWYMWLAYGGGILGVTAVVVVIVAMAPAPGRDGETKEARRGTMVINPDRTVSLKTQDADSHSI